MSTINTTEARTALLEKRRELLIRYYEELAHAAELQSTREPDWEDLAAAHRDAGVLDTLSDADFHALNALIAAIRRIDDGEYGKCITCGDAIASSRLEVMPEAAQCHDCAEENEQAMRTVRT